MSSLITQEDLLRRFDEFFRLHPEGFDFNIPSNYQFIFFSAVKKANLHVVCIGTSTLTIKKELRLSKQFPFFTYKPSVEYIAFPDKIFKEILISRYMESNSKTVDIEVITFGVYKSEKASIIREASR